MSSRKGSWGLLPGSVAYKYAIDVFSSVVVSGWCFNRFAKTRPLELEFYCGDRLLGACPVDIVRADLKQQGLHPTGICGFSFVLPGASREQPARLKADITIRVKHSGRLLCVLKRDLVDTAGGRAEHPFNRMRALFTFTSPSDGRVFFMHIPKTAGTTFNTFARQCYPRSRAISHIEAYDSSEYARIGADHTFISGHLNAGQMLRYFPPERYRYFTLMREPYAQLHSHINWLRGIGADRSSAFYQSHHGLFKQVAADIAQKSQLDPDDLQYLVERIDGVLKKLLDNNQTRYFLSAECDRPGWADLDQAQENMQQFELIGVTEEYERFRAAFCKANSIKYRPQGGALNRAGHAPLYDYQDPLNQKILEPLVEKDLVLYQLAREAWV